MVTLSSLNLKQKCLLTFIASVCMYAIYMKFMTLEGIRAIFIFSIISYLHFRDILKRKIYNFAILLMFISMTWMFVTHKIAGFSNPIVFDHIKVSPISSYYSMRINFDKVIAALIIFALWNENNLKWRLSIKQIKITFITAITCIISMMIPALLSGYVKFDPKIPNIAAMWIMNNLFCVCFSEEVVFRLFLQRKLYQLTGNSSLAIIIASVIFGFSHYYMNSGIIMAVLSFVCGIFYGYAFLKTSDNLLCAMLVHFSLNLCHFLFFTYPSFMK